MGRTIGKHINEYKFHTSITSQDSENIARFFSDIKKYASLTKEQERQLIIRIQDDNDKKALDQLVQSNLRFVVTVAKRYQGQGVHLMDLVQDGASGLIEAAYKFDRSHDLKFFSYAVWWIKIKIITNFNLHKRLIRLPENRSLFITKLKRKSQQLEDKLHRPPTVDELHQHFPDQSLDDLNEAIAFTTLPISLQTQIYERYNDHDVELIEVLEVDNPLEIDSTDHNHSLQSDLNKLLHQLPQRNYDLLVLTTGLNGEEVFGIDKYAYLFEIDKKEIAKLKAKTVKLLKKYKNQTNLNEYL